jgi:hypothetical protein
MPENARAAREGADHEYDSHEYDRFAELAVDEVEYGRVADFLDDRVTFTPREWAVARLCADFRTETGVEMTRIGEHLPELVPFMTDPYSRQAVYQARRDFERKVRVAGATFLYGAYSGFFTADELDDLMYESVKTAKFLLEVEGADVSLEEELRTEERVRDAMREIREASAELRYDRCPHCQEDLGEEAEPAE